MPQRSRSLRSTLALAGLGGALLAAACIAPEEAPKVRYFRAEAPLAAAPASDAASAAPVLRLRRLTAAGHLRERMALRVAPHEVELLELERWTEPPLAYLDRALSRALFESGALRRADDLSAPALDVALLAFEELAGPEPAVEIALELRLFGTDAVALLERTVVVREPLREPGPSAAASALATALERAAAEAAEMVRGALGAG